MLEQDEHKEKTKLDPPSNATKEDEGKLRRSKRVKHSDKASERSQSEDPEKKKKSKQKKAHKKDKQSNMQPE